MTAELLPILVLLPLAASAAVALLPVRARFGVTLAAVLAMSAVGSAVIADVASGGGRRIEIALGDWGAPVGILLRADAASAVMIGATAVIAVAITAYAAGHPSVRGSDAFWSLWLALLGSLNAVWLAGDLFNAYVALELLTIAAVSLIALGGSKAAGPALRYLFVAVLGSLFFLLAVALVYGETGTLDIQLAGDRLVGSPLLGAILALTAVGMGAKMALVPLHSWLPVAHPAAPAAVSAALSALVIKAALFVMWRVWFEVARGADAAAQVGTVVAAAGAAAVLWGAFMALRRTRLKQIVAYSTVSQVGYLVLIFALVRPDIDADASLAGWTGAVALVLAHGLAKAAMFLAAGTLALAYGSDRLLDLRGAISRKPVAVAALAISGVSLAGLPPTFGFVPKWQLLESAVGSDQWWWLIPLLVGGLLAFAYTAAMLRATFNSPGDELVPEPSTPTPWILSAVPFALAVLALVLGAASLPILELIADGYPEGMAP